MSETVEMTSAERKGQPEGKPITIHTSPEEATKTSQETKSNDSAGKFSVCGCLKKYFWEGQELQETEMTDVAKDGAEMKKWHQKYRRQISVLLPAAFFHIIWWSYMISQNRFGVFGESAGKGHIPRYYMSITMMFGAMIAGATSEGGASVAFPVMTLAFGIKPAVARDFSFMIQSAGMTAAAVAILWMKVKVEKHSILYCTIGGIIGILFGLDFIAPALTPAYSKMFFVSIWFAFAFSLFWLNRLFGRKVYLEIPFWEDGVLYQYKFITINWKALMLILFGFFGGIFSSIAGSGIDICSFACLTLLFRVSEKTATPTSVILMAINTCVGFFWREVKMGGVEPHAWGYFLVCVPIVVICAPLGSVIGSHFHRLVLASFVYVTDTVQLVGALIIVRPWSYKKTKTPAQLTGTSLGILIVGAILFRYLAKAGEKMMDEQEQRHNKKPEEPTISA